MKIILFIKTNQPRASVSEVLNALDMPGAVKDIKRFNYVCKVRRNTFLFSKKYEIF